MEIKTLYVAVCLTFIAGCAPERISATDPTLQSLGSTIENKGKLRMEQITYLTNYAGTHTQAETLGRCIDIVGANHKANELSAPSSGSAVQYCGDVMSVYVYE
ncbi:hypothetical protein QS468_25095 [Bacillus subtilis]|nr:hypothetical protein [Pseudomonas sp. A29(2023)]MDL5596019.1 hypothetical protein [Bacillus subtilis]